MAYTAENYLPYTGSNAIAGKKFLLYIAMKDGDAAKWILLGGQRDTGLEISSDTIDATDKANEGWADTIPGMRSWSASPSCVVRQGAATLDFVETWVFDDELQNQRPAIRVAFVNEATKQYYDSWCTVTNFSYSGSYDDVLTVDLELNGICALVKRENFNAETIVD